MKKFSLVLAVLSLSTSAFAAVPCASEIQSKALAKAQSEGLENCKVGKPTLSSAIELRLEYGSIGLFCQHHISPMSFVSEPVSYVFSRLANQGCEDVTVSDSLPDTFNDAQ